MGREVDYDSPSDEDLQYLRERPWLVDQAEREGNDSIREQVEKDLPEDSADSTGTLPPVGEAGVTELENPAQSPYEAPPVLGGSGRAISTEGAPEDLAKRKSEDDGGMDGDSDVDTSGSDSDSNSEEDDYDEWTVADLQTELENRELPKSGKKDELVARLREDDASDEEA